MPVPESGDAVDRHLLRDTAYEKLCEAIVDGTLAPGEPLHDEELCGWLGLSRTPVRDALRRLRRGGPRRDGPAAVHAGRRTLTIRDVHEVVPAPRRRCTGWRPSSRCRVWAARRSATLRGQNEAFSSRCASATAARPTVPTTASTRSSSTRAATRRSAASWRGSRHACAALESLCAAGAARPPLGRPAPGDHHARRDRRRGRRGVRRAGELDGAGRGARGRLRGRRHALAPRPAGEPTPRDLRPEVDEARADRF